MRIVIVGAGKVGTTLAEALCGEEQDVTIIDEDEHVISRCEDDLDVLCIQGNGAQAQTLAKANMSRCDILIAATAGDEVNMLCCLIGKSMGAKYTIARIRDPEYHESIQLFKAEMGIDMTINPERSTAGEISRLLRFPVAAEIQPFAHDTVEVVAFRARENDPFIGIPLKEIFQRLPKMPRVLFTLVERDGMVNRPKGDFEMREDDRIFVAGEKDTITRFFRFIGRSTDRAKRVMILGGGRISYYLARTMLTTGAEVTIIERKSQKARQLSELLPNVNVIEGDGSDQELLEQEGVRGMDAFIALTDRDEENLMTGLFVSSLGVKKVIVKNNRSSYQTIISRMGLDSVVSPRDITAASILRLVRARISRSGTMEKLYPLVKGKAEALEFVAKADDPFLGIPLKALNVHPSCQVSVIVRKNHVIIPFGDDFIEAGDHVLITASETGIVDLNEIIKLRERKVLGADR